jgi:hypothetical protein
MKKIICILMLCSDISLQGHGTTDCMREAWVVFLGRLYFKALPVLILLALGCICDKKIQPYVQLSVVFHTVPYLVPSFSA